MTVPASLRKKSGSQHFASFGPACCRPDPTRRPPKSAGRSAYHKGQVIDLPLVVSWRGGQDCCWVTLTIQGTPNLSVHMPNSSPHICFSRGMVTVPPSESFSQ
jgi:hypothetical protein